MALALQIPLTALIQFADPKSGYLTDEGRTVIQQLINRTGGAIGGTILFAGAKVYGAPTGTLLRTTFVSDPALPVGAAYSQAEMTAVKNQVIALGERLAALITDARTVGVIQ